jgi:hypothetical protein
MQRLFVLVFGAALVIGSTPSFARGGGLGMGRGAGAGIARGMGPRVGNRVRGGIGRGARIRMPATTNPIPSPQAGPAQAPIINGPLNSNGLPSMGGV